MSVALDAHDQPESGCPDFGGMRILLVEDSLSLGLALKSLLEVCGANVAGPVATTADAYRLIAESLPEAALVDIHLQWGERADDLIGHLHDQGVRVVVVSGDTVPLLAPGLVAAALPKPFSEEQLFAAMLPSAARNPAAANSRP